MSKTIEVGFPVAGFSFMSPAVTRFSPLSHHSLGRRQRITWAPSTKKTPQPSLEVTLSMALGFMRRFS